jgi:hypothetical protein
MGGHRGVFLVSSDSAEALSKITRPSSFRSSPRGPLGQYPDSDYVDPLVQEAGVLAAVLKRLSKTNYRNVMVLYRCEERV